MKTIVVLVYQSLFDLSIEYYGSVSAVFDIALANKMEITAVLIPGQEILLPAIEAKNKEVLQYFRSKGQHLATDNNLHDQSSPLLEGIDYWAISIDFIVK